MRDLEITPFWKSVNCFSVTPLCSQNCLVNANIIWKNVWPLLLNYQAFYLNLYCHQAKVQSLKYSSWKYIKCIVFSTFLWKSQRNLRQEKVHEWIEYSPLSRIRKQSQLRQNMESDMNPSIFIENKSQITDLWKNVWKRFDLKACLSARLI